MLYCSLNSIDTHQYVFCEILFWCYFFYKGFTGFKAFLVLQFMFSDHFSTVKDIVYHIWH